MLWIFHKESTIYGFHGRQLRFVYSQWSLVWPCRIGVNVLDLGPNELLRLIGAIPQRLGVGAGKYGSGWPSSESVWGDADGWHRQGCSDSGSILQKGDMGARDRQTVVARLHLPGQKRPRCRPTPIQWWVPQKPRLCDHVGGVFVHLRDPWGPQIAGTSLAAPFECFCNEISRIVIYRQRAPGRCVGLEATWRTVLGSTKLQDWWNTLTQAPWCVHSPLGGTKKRNAIN